MRKLKILLSVFLLIISIKVNAQIDASTALIALEELDVTVENTMNDIQLLTDNAIGDGGNMLLSVISRLREDIKNTIGQADKVLRENQLILFNNISNEVEKFNLIAENKIVDIDAMTTRVTSAINDFWGKKREPRILTYETPTYTVNNNSNYEINIIGEDFDRSFEKYLMIDNVKTPISQISQNKLKIIIPQEIMDSVSDNEKRFIESQLVFKYKKGFIFKKSKVKHFDFVIPCVPKKIGTAIAFYEQKIPKIEYFPLINYKAETRSGSSNWRGKKKIGKRGINILPTKGRYIDPTSFKIISWYKRHGGGYTINTVTEQYIKGSIYCKSDNKPYGGGGKATLELQYREFKTEYPLTRSQTPVSQLEADKLLIIKLPDPIDEHRPNLNYVKVLTFDGKEHIITTSNQGKYFSLVQNIVTDDLELKFKK